MHYAAGGRWSQTPHLRHSSPYAVVLASVKIGIGLCPALLPWSPFPRLALQLGLVLLLYNFHSSQVPCRGYAGPVLCYRNAVLLMSGTGIICAMLFTEATVQVRAQGHIGHGYLRAETRLGGEVLRGGSA